MNHHKTIFSFANVSKYIIAMVLMTMLSTESPAQSLQEQLNKQLPAIIQYCNQNDIKTVGVLKFRTKKPNEKTSDSAGPINSLIADRVECGLILANPFDESKQINVIKNASDQLTSVKGANHLTKEGRQVCFGQDFEIAWGIKRMKPDAFLTGVVQLHKDGETVTVGILCFKNDGGPMEQACEVFQAELDANTASELGESFVMRAGVDASMIRDLTKSLLDQTRKPNQGQQNQPSQPNSNQTDTGQGSQSQTNQGQRNQGQSKPQSPTNGQLNKEQIDKVKSRAAVKKSTQVKEEKIPFPLFDPAAPIRLLAYYDGVETPVQVKGGRAFLPEPNSNQKVEFLLMRGEQITKRLAVVLKVNGENTLFRQTARDIDCAKWLLSDQTKQIRVRGYQLRENNEMEEFKVLTREESAKRAMDYGRQVGQIHLAVFQEADPKDNSRSAEEPDLVDEMDEDMLAMMRGAQPIKKPANLGSLKQQMRKPNANELATRGLIVQGEKKKNAIKRHKMTSDPTPIMAVTITYYSASN